MSDEGQAYFEMLRSIGKTPHEFREMPTPSRYFVEEAHAEHRRRMAEAQKSWDVGE